MKHIYSSWFELGILCNCNNTWVLEGANSPNGLNAPGPSVYLGIQGYTVLPATCTLYPIGTDLSPITTQSSIAAIHCILAAPQFDYPERMEG
jgi:hypothetical protein